MEQGERRPVSIAAAAVGAVAIGAVAVGALALGAVAIGRLAIRRLGVQTARFHKLEVDELIVGRLRIKEQIGTLVSPPTTRSIEQAERASEPQ